MTANSDPTKQHKMHKWRDHSAERRSLADGYLLDRLMILSALKRAGSLAAVLTLMSTAAPVTRARAADVAYSATIDLRNPDNFTINSDGVQIFLPGFDTPGAADLALHPGDTLTGTVTFGGDRMQISDAGHLDREILTFFPFISSDLSNTVSSGTLTLLGVEGDYSGPAIVTGSIDGAVLGGYRIGDLTPSSFSFSGIRFSLDYEQGEADTFYPYVVAQFSFVNGAVLEADPVPEPASWVLMIVGVTAVGGMARQRRTLCDRRTE